MPLVNEFTPLLVTTDEQFNVRPTRRRSAWQYVLAGALSLGVLSLFQQRQPLDSTPLNIADVAVSLDETSPFDDTDNVAFLSSMETFKDTSMDPCVDFYQYACGGWLKANEIPLDRPSIDSSFYVVSESNKDTIRKIFDQNPPQIGQLYHSCLIDQEVDADAVAFVAQLIGNVHQVNSTLALMELAGEMDQFLGISTFFSLFVGADPEDPSTNVLQLSQGGLTLPSREYYLEESKVDAFAALYVDYVTKLFAVGELDNHNISAYAEAVLETETAFANISLPNAALRNPWTTNRAYPFAEIATRYPFLMAYLNGIYKQEPFPMLHAIIATPDFFAAQNELLSDESLLPQLKNYLSFHLIDSFGANLGEYFRRASHEFHGKIQGVGALLPRDQFCVRITTAFLGDELGKYYMQDVFGPDAKAAAQALVAEIEESLKALLLTESWLDKVTYDAAVEKLNKVKNYIGGPDDVPPLPFELQADAFFNNVKSLMQLSAAGTIQAIGKPVNEQAWDMFPSTVNAYYDPSANKMVFPAAILQPPFYSVEHFPAAANFARIGMVMGHELSHGFDDQGRNYDGNGALRSWWTPSVSAEFAEKAQCLAAQYSTFPVVSIEDGHVLGTVNGNLTLGENIADNGGIHLAYEAYHLWKSTFAPPPIVPPETPSPPAEPVETPSPEPVETEPTPDAVSPSEKQTPEPSSSSPNDNISAVTPAPVVPIPEEPVPEPTETLPPPVLPVPEAETPQPAQTDPSREIPVATPTPPPVVPEPQPTDIVPGEVIPDETSPAPEVPGPEDQTPAPTETEPVTEAPTVTPTSPPTVPTPPVVPDVPDTPTPPNVPDIPTPPVPTPPPAIVPPPQPEPTDEAPKHKHKKEKEEPAADPEDEKHREKRKNHEDESEKDKKSDKSEDEDKSHKHSSDKYGEKTKEEQKNEKSHEGKHGHEKRDDKDDEGKSKKDHDTGDSKAHHRHEGDSKTEDEDSKKHKKQRDESKDKDESEGRHGKEKHHHEDEDSERDESEGEHHHEKRDEEDDRDKHERHEHESKHDHHRRDEEIGEEEDSDRHGGKHHGHKEHGDRKKEEEDRRHRKISGRWDEDDGESEWHKHHKHGKKEKRREERNERKESKQHKKADQVFEEKHHHRWDEDYGDDEGYQSRHHNKHRRHEEEREERWEECGDCGREKHHRHHHHKHEEDWDKEWERRGCGDGCGKKRHQLELLESKYPFSGGDAKIHTMIEKLARAIVQPNDPVADDRLFFTAFAQNWCEERTPGYAELLRTIDPHSPGKWRVNGPLMNYDKFSVVFSCPVGTPMNPEKKCVIW